jgi:hypothetical protein
VSSTLTLAFYIPFNLFFQGAQPQGCAFLMPGAPTIGARRFMHNAQTPAFFAAKVCAF